MSSDTDTSSSSKSVEDGGYECEICLGDKYISEIVTLKCKHLFCLLCLEEYILNNLSIKIQCPTDACDGLITDIQIKEVLSNEDVKRYDRLCMDNIPDVHCCLLPECEGTVWYKKGDKSYICNNCSLFNCILCNKPHKSMSCSKFAKLSSEKAKLKCTEEMEQSKLILLQKSLSAIENDLILNDRIFSCLFCGLSVAKGSGVKIRSCEHLICRECLKCSIISTPVIPPKCQYEDCQGTLQDREVYAILSNEELVGYNRKNFTRIKLKLDATFQCQEPNCDFFCELIDSEAKVFYCNKCQSENCLKCKAIHAAESCVQYQDRIKKTEAHIEQSILDGEFMKCPDCLTLVKKGRGCNWIQCSNCGLELCWILKMRRWGPNGRGDISGGCRCEVDGFCHPGCYGCIPDN